MCPGVPLYLSSSPPSLPDVVWCALFGRVGAAALVVGGVAGTVCLLLRPLSRVYPGSFFIVIVVISTMVIIILNLKNRTTRTTRTARTTRTKREIHENI